MFLGLTLTLCSSAVVASEYCTKDQYQHDRELIESARSSGTLVEGPKGFRDSVLVQEGMWFGMNYPQQIAFMQSFECSVAGSSGKHLLIMDVRSLATGKLLATWFAGSLKPSEEPNEMNNPEMPEMLGDDRNTGLTGQGRAVFVQTAMDECKKRSNSTPRIDCSCYANTMADSISSKELKEIFALQNREADIPALRTRTEAAAKHCLMN